MRWRTKKFKVKAVLFLNNSIEKMKWGKDTKRPTLITSSPNNSLLPQINPTTSSPENGIFHFKIENTPAFVPKIMMSVNLRLAIWQLQAKEKKSYWLKLKTNSSNVQLMVLSANNSNLSYPRLPSKRVESIWIYLVVHSRKKVHILNLCRKNHNSISSQ